MSEYQYYEFQAIDRPLSGKEMDRLRSYSTRARITTTSFVNEYQWGNFKGDADGWMDRYFDAFMYIANWGTRVLKVRLPSTLLSLSEVRPYCAGRGLEVRHRKGSVILTLSSDDEGGDGWVDPEGMLASLIPVRADLARGDHRALYLGWLAAAQAGELSEDDREPPVPPGLGQLNASLEALAEFLRVDEDLLLVAAQASAPLLAQAPSHDRLATWVSGMPASEKDAVLVRLLSDDAVSVSRELYRRFRKSQEPSGPRAREGDARSFGEIREAAEATAKERESRKRKRRAPSTGGRGTRQPRA
jgi:hypothetical protein